MTKIKTLIAKAALVASAIGLASSANAATATASFQVVITIQSACTVTAGAASKIDLGSVLSSATNTLGTSSIAVTCSKKTPYYIGLAPSVANGGTTTGAGAMSTSTALAGNTDKVPYQLTSTAGATGTVWGNTATSTTVGNGVSGIGSGAAQTLNVYAYAASANFTPDSYADTVTVNVNY